VPPSGDHTGASLRPRAKTGSGGLDPSSGAIQSLPSCVNAPRGALLLQAGSSPSAISLGALPPAAATAQTCIFPCTGLLVGSGMRLPSARQFEPSETPGTS